MFRDRADAGRALAARLSALGLERPVVLALPRGGVPVGYEVARWLDAPLDLVLVRKIGAPNQRELAVGAVAEGPDPQIFVNEEIARALGLTKRFFDEESARELEEIARRRTLYLGARPRVSVAGRPAIVVDDGIATGATMRVALRAVRAQGPSRLVLAAPVAPPDTIAALRPEADDVVCLAEPEFFGAISMFYSDFQQLSDEDVAAILDKAPGEAEAPGSSGATEGA